VVTLPDPRAAVRNGIGALFGSDRFPEEQYDAPLGDEGLFGTDSVTWIVHADVSMFVGGIAALMLQSLHPRAARIVARSSRFREEPFHRLSRTGSFVAATTYAATPVAEAVIDHVRETHARIGADDPDLLTWVHVAEVTSFMAAYRRYAIRPLMPGETDQYFAEMVVVAERLGARDVPRSGREIRAYYERVRPELAASAESVELMEFVQRPIGRDPITRAAHALLVQAAQAQLPGWARELHGIALPPGVDVLVLRPWTWSLLEALRLSLGSSPIVTAARRRSDTMPQPS
jgi:uncharacterized protein (DUF2236 family)